MRTSSTIITAALTTLMLFLSICQAAPVQSNHHPSRLPKMNSSSTVENSTFVVCGNNTYHVLMMVCQGKIYDPHGPNSGNGAGQERAGFTDVCCRRACSLSQLTAFCEPESRLELADAAVKLESFSYPKKNQEVSVATNSIHKNQIQNTIKSMTKAPKFEVGTVPPDDIGNQERLIVRVRRTG